MLGVFTGSTCRNRPRVGRQEGTCKQNSETKNRARIHPTSFGDLTCSALVSWRWPSTRRDSGTAIQTERRPIRELKLRDGGYGATVVPTMKERRRDTQGAGTKSKPTLAQSARMDTRLSNSALKKLT